MSATTTAPDTTDPTIRPRLIATTTITRTTGTVAHPPRIATIRVGLDDGRAAALRPSSVQDLEAITDLYEALGPESRRLRFLQAMPEVPIRTMRSLVEIDQRDHLAWVAFDGTRCVGEARVVRLRRDRRAGEVAFAVHPDWRRIGLARRLVRTVGSAARSLGVHTMTASVSSDNRASAALLVQSGATFRVDSGLLEGEGAMPTWQGEPVLHAPITRMQAVAARAATLELAA